MATDLGGIYYSLFLKDQTDKTLKEVNAKLKDLGFDIQLTPKILKDLTQSAVPKGIKIELDPTIKNDALARAVEGKVMRVAVTPLLTGFREAIVRATRENPPQAEVGVSEARLRSIIQNVLNKQGFMLNVSTVNDNYSKAIQAKLNGTRYNVKIHADANEISRSVQASLMQVQSRHFGLQVSRDMLYRSIDEALGQKRFNINIAVQHDQARRAVQDALLRAQVIGKDQALAYQRLQTGEMKAAQAELMRLKTAHQEAANAVKAHATASVNLGGAMGSNIKIAGELGSAMASLYSIHAAKQFLSQVVEIGGELEHQKIAMDTIFGDKGKTNQLFGQIKGLARQSPFGVMELTSSIKRLSAYGVEYNEIYDTAKRLADISAATSVDINRLILAFGKTKSRGFLDGLEAKQFAYANIPIYEMVRKKLEELEGQAVTTADVMARMKKREIGFDIVKDVLWDLTDEGGKFYNMQEALAGSVKTSWKLVRDNIELMFGEIAESSVGEGLKGIAEILQTLTREWRTIGVVIGAAAIGLGVYKVAILAANMAMDKSLVSTVKQSAGLKMQRYHANLAAQSYRKLTVAEEENYLIASASQKLTGLRIFSRKQLTHAEVSAMFNQKKLTKEQLLHLVALKKLTVANAGNLLITKSTTAADAALIRAEIAKAAAAKRGTVVWMQMKAAMAGVAGAMKALVWNPFTLVFAALSVGMGLWQKHREQIQKTKEATDAFTQKGREGFENLIKSANDLNSLDPAVMSGHELSNRIEEMKTTLKDYSLTAEETFEKVFGKDNNGKIRSQKEQFEMLRDAVNETAEAYRNMKNGEKSSVFKSEKSSEVNKSSKKYNEATVDVSDAYTKLLQYSNLLDDILEKAQINKNKNGVLDIDEEATKQLQEQLKLAESLDETLKIIYSLVPENGSLYFPGTTDPRVKGALDVYIRDLREQKQAEDAVTSSMRQKLQELQNINKEQYKNWNPANNQRQAEEYLQEAKAFAEASEEMSAAQKSLFMDLAYESIGKMSPRLREMREEVEKMVKTMQVTPEKFGLTNEMLEYVKLVERIRALPKEQQEQTIAEYEKLDPAKYVLLSDDVATDSERYMNQIKDALIKQAEEKYPELSDKIHTLIESDEFTALIKLKLQNGWQDGILKDFKALTDWQQEMFLAAVPDNAIRNKLINAMAGTQTTAEAIDALRKLYKEADGIIQNQGPILLKIKPTLDLSGGFNPNAFKGENKLVQQSAKETAEAVALKNALDKMFSEYGISATDPTKNKGKKGSQKNEFAEAVKERINLLKKAKSEYESLAKLIGKEAASDKLADSPIFEGLKANKFLPEQTIPKTLDEYEKALDKLQEQLTAKGLKTKKHRELNVEIEQVKFDIDKKRTQEALKLALDKVTKEAERQLADWNLFDKIRKATGNQDLAMSVAFGMNADATTDYPALVKKQFADLAKAVKGIDITFDNTTLKEAQDLGDEIAKSYQDTASKLEKYSREQKDAIADILNEYQSLQDKLTKIDSERDRKKKIVDDSTMSEPEKAAIKQRIDVEADYQKFTQSNEYLQFFAGIYALTQQEATRIGDLIEQNLNRRLQAGTISAEDYYKEIERVRQQLDKLRNVKSDAMTLLTGGVKGLNDKRREANDAERLKAVQKVEEMEQQLAEAKKSGNMYEISASEAQLEAAKEELSVQDKIREKLIQNQKNWQNVLDVANIAANIAGGMSDAFNSIKDMADAFGVDTESGAWGDIGAVLDTMVAVTGGVQKVVQSAMNGDIGGILGGVVSTITTPFTIWAQLHDKKLQKLIDRSKEAAQIMQNQYDILEKRMANFLGNAAGMNTGVTGGAYGKQRQLMQGQLRELEKQRQAEIDKKKTDKSAVEDYNKQIEEMKISIRDFAQEAAKELYGIDLNGWAEQLGDSLVSAFAAGEDAAKAFDKTVGDILRDVTSKMISQDILAPMFGDLRNFLFGENGMSGAFGADFKLDASEVAAMKEYLDRIKDDGIPAAKNLFDAINEATGGLLDDTDKAKSGLSAGIQSVTEDTADLLASYVNAIRASVAMNETRWERLLNDSLPQMNVIAESQLRVQNQIAANTLRNAEAAEAIVKSNDEINRLLARVTQGGAKFYIH